jgi:uncharacterized protein YlxW (UPF0749 family)
MPKIDKIISIGAQVVTAGAGVAMVYLATGKKDDDDNDKKEEESNAIRENQKSIEDVKAELENINDRLSDLEAANNK